MSTLNEKIHALELRKLAILGATIAAVSLLIMQHVPTSELLPMPARNTLFVLIAVIALLVTEVFPIGIVCLLAVPLMYFFKCTPSVPGALSGFTNPILYFVLASFGISEALTVVPVSKRLLLFLMKRGGKNTKRLMLAIMVVTALLSSIMSNVAAAALFVPVVLNFLDVYENEEDRNKTGRSYMIGLPVASMIGGMMTPAGSSINMLAISMLEKNAGMTITFVQWMFIGIPLTIVLLPIAWLICSKVFPPAPLEKEKIEAYVDSVTAEIPEKMGAKEKYVVIVLFGMLILWILSSWFPVLQISAVALIGLALYFLPGPLRVLTWADFKRSASIEAFLLLGVMISIGNVISESGLNLWIAEVIFPKAFPSSTVLVMGFIAVMVFLLLIIIPVAPALFAMLSGPLIAFCGKVGVSPAIAMAALGLCACNCYLLPLDTVPVITYSTGYYKMFDMPKATVWIQLVMIVICSLWLTIAGGILGI
ncbi:MAG: DASS family sodium-coupled anion symporter [Lachnospiraceae bacterium]|nr:DASS family sodium-coupled anion symporter [Lachnospiraceae bacterium]